MSGPEGGPNKRDQRRLARRDQYQQRQTERQRERQRQLRTQQIRRYSLIGGVALVVIVAIVLISVFAFHVGGSPGKGGYTPAAPTVTQGEFFDADGKPFPATTNTQQILLANHETLVIRYNSPNVHPAAHTTWPD